MALNVKVPSRSHSELQAIAKFEKQPMIQAIAEIIQKRYMELPEEYRAQFEALEKMVG